MRPLPNTSLVAITMNNHIYSYAQQHDGDLYEFRGIMKLVRSQSIFSNTKRSGVAVTRVEDGELAPNAPKLFTPLAATAFTPIATATMNTRYLFYVDDHNILRDAMYQDGSEDWVAGKLGDAEGGGIRCAPYSRLAAITIAGKTHNSMCLYFQAPANNATIQMVHYNSETNGWRMGTPNLQEEPLFGTSLTAVQPRPGNLPPGVDPNSEEARQAVYYHQQEDLYLAHAQGTRGPLIMSGLELDGKALIFAPQTSLNAVDDGNTLYLVYKSGSGIIKVIAIDNNRPKPPERFDDIRTTPRNSIAATLSPGTATTELVLFYQSLDQATTQVNLCAITLYKTAVPANSWKASAPVKLGH